MKLAEALLERADLQRNCAWILRRILDNALVQEGELPAENPESLLPQLKEANQRLAKLIQSINATNVATKFSDNETIADAIARRDILSQRLSNYREIYSKLQITQDYYGNTEIRMVRYMDPVKIQSTIDKLSKEYRELDTALQSLNWTVELQENL